MLFCVPGCALAVRVNEVTSIADAGGIGASLSVSLPVSDGWPMVSSPVSVYPFSLNRRPNGVS